MPRVIKKHKPMSKAEFARRMSELITNDTEENHIKADDLMVEALRKLGYGKGLKIFESIEKWYA